MVVVLVPWLLGATGGVSAADTERPTVTRKGSQAGFGDTTVRFPASKVERAPRITEHDGGYLELARSKDGRELWTRRWWDDGSDDVNHFRLNWTGERMLVLQFVDGVTEPWPKQRSVEDTLGRRVVKRSDGTMFEQILDAWPVDPERAEAFNLTTHAWVPLVKARKENPTGARTLQWMVFVERCPEVKGACVYYGEPGDVCGKYLDAVTKPDDQALWIAPKKKCRGHW
jgi:hypothetical protein